MALKSFDSLAQMMDAIPDEQAAASLFTAIRWKDGAFCPHCRSGRIYHFSDNQTHKCGACRKRFSIRIGTIFEGSKLPLRTWLMAIWLVTAHKKGIASTQLARDLGITQKSAWLLTQRLRHAISTQSFSGRAECDAAESEILVNKTQTRNSDWSTCWRQAGRYWQRRYSWRPSAQQAVQHRHHA